MKYDPECEVPSCYLVSDDDATFAQEKFLHEIQAYIEYENMRLEKESFQFSSKELIIRVEYKHYLISLLLMLLDLLLLHQVEKSCITESSSGSGGACASKNAA
nr:dynamin-like protein ARC5 [Populus alba]